MGPKTGLHLVAQRKLYPTVHQVAVFTEVTDIYQRTFNDIFFYEG